jgi:hypothetical protein
LKLFASLSHSRKRGLKVLAVLRYGQQEVLSPALELREIGIGRSAGLFNPLARIHPRLQGFAGDM